MMIEIVIEMVILNTFIMMRIVLNMLLLMM